MADWVERTRLLQASRLHVARHCRLRYLLETERSVAADLPPSPVALVGTAIHKVLEQKDVLSRIATVSDLRRQVHDTLKELVSHHGSIGELLAIVGGDVSAVLSPEQWKRRLSFAWRVRGALRVQDSPPDKSVRSGGPASGRDGADFVELGSEARVRSTRLGLEGRIDRLDAIGNMKLQITDYKTGHALDETGDLKEPYRLQLGAYALAIQSVLGARIDSIEIRILSAEGERSIAFSDSWAREVQDALYHLDNVIPKGRRMQTEELASPGEYCTGCSYRPRCLRYLERVVQEPEHSHWPLDAWGRVGEMRSQAASLVDVRIRKPAGDSVVIFGVPESWVRSDRGAVDFLAVFSLARMERDSNRYRPNNFVVVDRNTPFRSAFAATHHEIRTGASWNAVA